jgi:hypothetical protein
MPTLKARRQQPAPVNPQVPIPNDFPAIPKEIVDRFPDACRDWQKRLDEFWTRSNQAIQEAQMQTASQVNSTVVFSVESFLIYADNVPTPMFALDSTGIRLGNVLVIDTPGNKVYIGAGNYADDDTPFYIDTLGNFSLGASLTWDPDTDTLTITGIINATSGTIGGFDIGADYIRDTANTFGLASTVTGGDDVRLWAGETFANRDAAPFSVTEAGYIKTTGLGVGGIPVAGHIIDISQIIAIPIASGQFSYIRFSGQPAATANGQIAYGLFAAGSYEKNGFTGLEYDGILLASVVPIGSGTIATEHGIWIQSVSAGATTNIGLRISNVAATATSYGIFSETTAPNFFGGTLLIGNADTNLYRSAANTLKTDDAFVAALGFASTAGNNSTPFSDTSATTGYQIIELKNTGGWSIFAQERSTGGAIITGSSAYDTAIRGTSGIAFSASNGGAMEMRLASTGLAITGGLSVSGLAGVGTRNVVVDAAGVMSAP